MGNLHVATPWTAVFTPACSSNTISRHQWWCDPGYCHLQPHIGSIGPDRLTNSVLYFRVWAFMGPGTNFAIFQHCHHRFQCIEADIQLCSQFPSHNPPIRTDELIEVLFISWCDSCAWPSGKSLVFHVAFATAETRHPPPHCGNIHCLVSVNPSANIDECHWVQVFLHGGIQLHAFASYALPCQMPFCQSAPLLSSVALQQNLTEYWQEGSSSTAISPTSASDVVGQHNEIGVINFRATLDVGLYNAKMFSCICDLCICANKSVLYTIVCACVKHVFVVQVVALLVKSVCPLNVFIYRILNIQCVL